MTLSPEQREEARNLAAEMELATPERRLEIAQRLVKLEQLLGAVLRSRRAQHASVYQILADLKRVPMTPAPQGDLVDDADHELMMESCRRPRRCHP